MKAATRKRLEEIKSELSALTAEVEQIGADEREKFDNMNEGLQSTENGQKISDAADALESATSLLEEAFEHIDLATSN